jgi:transcriptional regulator with XRE-family HTH domain
VNRRSSTGASRPAAAAAPADEAAPKRPLHRLGEVRRQQRLSRRKIAHQLGISVSEVKQQEKPSSDMLLSNLLRWQALLDVPLGELLNEPDSDLSPPVKLRAGLLRAMKTAGSILRTTQQTSIRRMATMLVGQLVEIMPELEGITPWPTAHHRRRTRKIEPCDWHLVYQQKWK